MYRYFFIYNLFLDTHKNLNGLSILHVVFGDHVEYESVENRSLVQIEHFFHHKGLILRV
jgi:hypothetical protein